MGLLSSSLSLALVCVGCADGALSKDEAAADQAIDSSAWDALVAQAENAYGKNDHETSAELYRKAAQLAGEAGDERRAVALTAQRAVCLKFLGRTDEAREALVPTLARARELGDLRTEGLALGNLVRVEGLAGNDALALSYLDELAELAERIEDPRLEVQTLEQAAMLALDLGQFELALARIDTALEHNAANEEEDDRRDALMRQRAAISVRRRDDEGALAAWAAAPAVGASLANRALLLSELGLHQDASEVAAGAAVLFDAEGELRQAERDQALFLHLSEAVSAGQVDDVQKQLDAIFASAASARVSAPFRFVEGRLLLARGDAAQALLSLEQAREGFADDPVANTAALLAAVAEGLSGDLDGAHARLDVLAASPSRAVVRGWLMAEVSPSSTLSMERMPGLIERGGAGTYRELLSLRRACPVPLPSLAWIALHHSLADADRLRGAGRGEQADQLVRDGATLSLRWQLLERQGACRGDWPSADVTASAFARIDDWVAGRLSDDEAIVVVVSDTRLSYLLLCTSLWGATTFGLPPSKDLASRGEDIAQALKGGDTLAVAQAGRRLHQTLFGSKALEDLADHSRWALVLPESLASVPPALLVSADIKEGQPVSWQVLSHVLRLLPHAPLFDAAASAAEDRRGWLRFGEPLIVDQATAFTTTQLGLRYGAGALSTGPLRPGQPDTAKVAGAAATASALRDAAAQVAALELSVPAFGGGRLGGLLLSPDAAADFGDEQVGFMPWHRLIDLDLPPLVVFDRSRFDPGDPTYGVNHAGACVLAGGAQWLASTRWPLPPQVRVSLLGALSQEVMSGLAADVALATLHRVFL
ncbi:MAG: hypothetical protein ACI9EF_003452, partial [Pseudohongiellaceae bacterium]